MTPQRMAQIHAASFTVPRPWSAAEFAALTETKGMFLCLSAHGFLWGRSVVDEAELLTLAVDPQARGRGEGEALVRDFLSTARARGATSAFLEVAQTNDTAQRLYIRTGFAPTGLRPRYYSTQDGARIDAVLMGQALTE